jgi:glycosyltransferase involved in cell wall biosynthesis
MISSPLKMVNKKIAIDLTPMLPSGANGGIKLFIFELIRNLILVAKDTQFILLTQNSTHAELCFLEGRNIQLILMRDNESDLVRSKLISYGLRVFRRLPEVAKKLVSKHAVILFSALKSQPKKNFLSELNVDLLFCPFTAPTYSSANIPTVCTMHDLQHKTFPQFFKVEENIYRNFVFDQACVKSAVIAVDSNYTRASVLANCKYDPSKVRTIYLRLPKPVIEKNAQEVLSRYSLTHQRYLIYPANFWKHKNHEMLITAFNIAITQMGLPADIKLVCTGEPGERLDWLKQVTLRMGLKDKIVFPGYVPKSDLDQLLAHAGGMIFPSLYEGFGIPIIEAMSAGVPVACSNVGSLPEIADNAAILFNPRVPHEIATSMLQLFVNQGLCNKLKTTGLTRSVEFTDSKRMAQEYLSLFSYAIDIYAAEYKAREFNSGLN